MAEGMQPCYPRQCTGCWGTPPAPVTGAGGADPELLRRRFDPGPGSWTWGHRPGPLKAISPPTPPTHSVTASDRGSPPGLSGAPSHAMSPVPPLGPPGRAGPPRPLSHPSVAGLRKGLRVEGVRFGVRGWSPLSSLKGRSWPVTPRGLVRGWRCELVPRPPPFVPPSIPPM